MALNRENRLGMVYGALWLLAIGLIATANEVAQAQHTSALATKLQAARAKALATAASNGASEPLIVLPPPPTKPRTVTVGWDWPDVRFEVWSSTSLTDWTKRTDRVCAVEVKLPADKAAEYFKVRAVDPRTGAASDWGKL